MTTRQKKILSEQLMGKMSNLPEYSEDQEHEGQEVQSSILSPHTPVRYTFNDDLVTSSLKQKTSLTKS